MTIAYETIEGDKKIPGAIHQSDEQQEPSFYQKMKILNYGI